MLDKVSFPTKYKFTNDFIIDMVKVNDRLQSRIALGKGRERSYKEAIDMIARRVLAISQGAAFKHSEEELGLIDLPVKERNKIDNFCKEIRAFTNQLNLVLLDRNRHRIEAFYEKAYREAIKSIGSILIQVEN